MKVNINAKTINQMVTAETANIEVRNNLEKGNEKIVESPLASADDPVNGGVFISYRRKDSADIVGRIYDQLVEHFGKPRIFRDVYSIPLGADFRDHINKAVGNCNVLIAVIGDRWLEKDASTGSRRIDDPQDFVRIEIESALLREIPVVPLLVRGVLVPSKDELPDSLSKLAFKNAQALRPDPDFHPDMDRLIVALDNYVKRTS